MVEEGFDLAAHRLGLFRQFARCLQHLMGGSAGVAGGMLNVDRIGRSVMLLFRFLLWFYWAQNAPRGSICPDDRHSRIVHHCEQTDSDNRDPLTFGSGWARLNERVIWRCRMRRRSWRNPNA